jgi:hypothetical protein
VLCERGIQKHYFAWARSTTVSRRPELFRLWRTAGLDAVFLGFEAINDADLDQISKHSSVADNERAHATLRELGIAVQAGFMVNAGFTRQNFRDLQDYMKRMPPAQITCTVYTLLAGQPGLARRERALRLPSLRSARLHAPADTHWNSHSRILSGIFEAEFDRFYAQSAARE